MKNTSRAGCVVFVALLQIACSEQAVYTQESFSSDSPFKLRVEDSATLACESARRSLLGQGYLIEQTNAEQVKGRKAYRNADGLNTLIEMNVVCIDESDSSTVFANGVLSTFDLKKSSSSASVGVSAVGSISLPIGQSADSLVKIAEETIDDKAFYSRFFAAVEHTLQEMRTRRASVPGPAASAPAPEPGPGPATVPAESGVAPSAVTDPDAERQSEIGRPEINRDDARIEMESIEINREDARTVVPPVEINRDDAYTASQPPEVNRDDSKRVPQMRGEAPSAEPSLAPARDDRTAPPPAALDAASVESSGAALEGPEVNREDARTEVPKTGDADISRPEN